MAAGALRAALGPEGARVEVVSAGTAAWDDQPATPESVAVAAVDGVDLREHRSRRLTPEILRGADLVIAMERAHARTVQSLGADPKRTHVLSEWPEPGDPELEVSDPYGGSREAYEECWRRIRAHVERLTPFVLEAMRARSY
jgi:protein-tyrosine phosphatase